MRLAAVALVVTAACGRVGFDASSSGDAGVDTDGGPDATLDRPNQIFMTSASYTADLGGLAGADALCSSTAENAGLEGEFRAVLETTTVPLASRFVGSRGWVDLRGTPIIDKPEDFADKSIHPLRTDENAADIAALVSAWRGGEAGNCGDWTDGSVGQTKVIPRYTSFQSDTYASCSSMIRLICAEVGHVAALPPGTETGRIVFVTAQSWMPAGGLAAADAHCQGEADAAGLGGTFRAFLPMPGASAESRFDAQRMPWRRVDGWRITETASELVGPAPVAEWKTFIARTATGAPTNARPWTGTTTDNCAGWTSSAAQSSHGSSHSTLRSSLQLFPPSGCGTTSPLICLEE